MDIKLNKLIYNYGYNSHRMGIILELFRYLLKFKKEFKDVNINIFGSFISTKSEPNDIDVFINIEDLDLKKINSLKKIGEKSPRYVDINLVNVETNANYKQEAISSFSYLDHKKTISFSYLENRGITKIFVKKKLTFNI